MTLTIVNERKVIGELWVSLVSLILSYVAGHELGKIGGSPAVTQGKEGRVTIASEGRMLAIECVTDCETSGIGEWRLIEEAPDRGRVLSKGSFRIGADSMVEFSDRKGKLELEVAAEAFTAKIFDEM
ncbi:MAG TPA: hypothetical protein VGD59_12485 [Acidisarcina sp.]